MPTTSDTPVLSARAVAVRHRTPAGDVAALRGVSLEVAVGGLVAVVGANGAGKSTLLRVLAGEVRPSAGRAWVLGSDPVLRRRAGLPSAHLLRGEAQVRPRHPVLPRGPVARSVAIRLASAGVAGRRPPGRSTGERALADLVGVLATDPLVLLADDPARSLDPHAAGAMVAVLRAFVSTGRTALLSTTDPRIAAQCDRAIVLDRGRIIGEVAGGSVAAPAAAAIADLLAPTYGAGRRMPSSADSRIGPR